MRGQVSRRSLTRRSRRVLRMCGLRPGRMREEMLAVRGDSLLQPQLPGQALENERRAPEGVQDEACRQEGEESQECPKGTYSLTV